MALLVNVQYFALKLFLAYSSMLLPRALQASRPRTTSLFVGATLTPWSSSSLRLASSLVQTSSFAQVTLLVFPRKVSLYPDEILKKGVWKNPEPFFSHNRKVNF